MCSKCKIYTGFRGQNKKEEKEGRKKGKTLITNFILK
jgi:hypothetical protein